MKLRQAVCIGVCLFIAAAHGIVERLTILSFPGLRHRLRWPYSRSTICGQYVTEMCRSSKRVSRTAGTNLESLATGACPTLTNWKL